MKHNPSYIIWVALTVAIGGLLLGFDATVISGTAPFIKEYSDLTGAASDLKLGWAVSCLGRNLLIGIALAGFLSDRLGRKRILILTVLLCVISGLLPVTAIPAANP